MRRRSPVKNRVSNGLKTSGRFVKQDQRERWRAKWKLVSEGGRAWGRVREGIAPSRCEGLGLSPSGKFCNIVHF